jgi:uncharacterized membrane protein
MLASSRGARRLSAREDRRKALVRFFRFLFGVAGTLCGIAFDLVLLAGTPMAYLAASFALFDVPAGWMFGHKPLTGMSLGVFAAAVLVSAFGFFRALQGAQPVAPVRPKFARAMLVLGWATGFLLAIADLSA